MGFFNEPPVWTVSRNGAEYPSGISAHVMCSQPVIYPHQGFFGGFFGFYYLFFWFVCFLFVCFVCLFFACVCEPNHSDANITFNINGI